MFSPLIGVEQGDFMRSYTYSSEAKWAVCKDTLPATVPSTKYNYSASEEEQQAWVAYRDALHQLGFQTSSSTYTCRFGALSVHGRNHAKLAQQRKQTETYDFLCVLRLGGTAIRVWIDSLPNLFVFFTDLDAHPVDDTLKDFLADDTLQKLLSHLSVLADQIWEGQTRFSVEIEPPLKS
jgi:hypothetical protein